MHFHWKREFRDLNSNVLIDILFTNILLIKYCSTKFARSVIDKFVQKQLHVWTYSICYGQ